MVSCRALTTDPIAPSINSPFVIIKQQSPLQGTMHGIVCTVLSSLCAGKAAAASGPEHVPLLLTGKWKEASIEQGS